MIIGMSHEDLKKLKAGRKAKEDVRPRKKRTTTISVKVKEKAFKNLKEKGGELATKISVDPHVKMNDNYMRTGWYKPIKKDKV
tara:strand:+ start:782 stop:1030 length:249 start_codon:yes stop_codon:yes gene_type:complete